MAGFFAVTLTGCTAEQNADKQKLTQIINSQQNQINELSLELEKKQKEREDFIAVLTKVKVYLDSEACNTKNYPTFTNCKPDSSLEGFSCFSY